MPMVSKQCSTLNRFFVFMSNGNEYQELVGLFYTSSVSVRQVIWCVRHVQSREWHKHTKILQIVCKRQVDGEATASATVETVAPKYKTKNIDLILYGMFIDVVVLVV